MNAKKRTVLSMILLLAMLSLEGCRSLDCGCPMTGIHDRQLPETPEDQLSLISSSFSS
jgi:hypothetical protein